MNWLQKISQRWLEAHPDYDIANHLHAAFSAMLPVSEGDKWEVSADVFYVPSASHREDYREDSEGAVGTYTNSNIASLAFMYRDRWYILKVTTIKNTYDNSGFPLVNYQEYMKQYGFKGTLTRSFDRESGVNDKKDLGEVQADNPYDFIEQVIAMIQADRFGGNDENEPGDLFPDWPYSETDFTDEPEDELSRLVAPRVRGYA